MAPERWRSGAGRSRSGTGAPDGARRGAGAPDGAGVAPERRTEPEWRRSAGWSRSGAGRSQSGAGAPDGAGVAPERSLPLLCSLQMDISRRTTPIYTCKLLPLCLTTLLNSFLFCTLPKSSQFSRNMHRLSKLMLPSRHFPPSLLHNSDLRHGQEFDCN